MGPKKVLSLNHSRPENNGNEKVLQILETPRQEPNYQMQFNAIPSWFTLYSSFGDSGVKMEWGIEQRCLSLE